MNQIVGRKFSTFDGRLQRKPSIETVHSFSSFWQSHHLTLYSVHSFSSFQQHPSSGQESFPVQLREQKGR